MSIGQVTHFKEWSEDYYNIGVHPWCRLERYQVVPLHVKYKDSSCNWYKCFQFFCHYKEEKKKKIESVSILLDRKYGSNQSIIYFSLSFQDINY